MTLKDFVDITVGENEDPLTAITVIDSDGNFLYWSELRMCDYYHIQNWPITRIRVTQEGEVELTLNGGNFEEHHLLNVYPAR